MEWFSFQTQPTLRSRFHLSSERCPGLVDASDSGSTLRAAASISNNARSIITCLSRVLFPSINPRHPCTYCSIQTNFASSKVCVSPCPGMTPARLFFRSTDSTLRHPEPQVLVSALFPSNEFPQTWHTLFICSNLLKVQSAKLLHHWQDRVARSLIPIHCRKEFSRFSVAGPLRITIPTLWI